MKSFTFRPALHAAAPRPAALQLRRPVPLPLLANSNRLRQKSTNLYGYELRKPLSCAASAGNSLNPIEALKREGALQSNKLPDNVRERVEGAIERLRFRVTIGDVAAAAGVKLSEAEEALKALAYDSLAALEVGEEGDVVYTFPPDFRSSIRTKSVILSVKPVISRIQEVGFYMMRIAFGTSLISSLVIVWLAVAVVLSSSSRDDRGNNRGGSYGGGYSSYNGGGLHMAMNITDIFYWFDPYYYQNRSQRAEEGTSMSFLESIFSFVFGDGDPNLRFEEARFRQLGKVIQDKGGVVTAEEIAPFLDPPAWDSTSTSSAYEDESFVLPALVTFGGEPFVDGQGNLLYRFPSLQTSSSQKEYLRPQKIPNKILERNWEFTAASAGQIFGTIALGLVNVAGVVTLSNLMVNPQTAYVLAANGLGWLPSLLPWLQVYAASFFGIPAFRWLVNMQRNAAIDDRNMARAEAADSLAIYSKTKLASKLASARQGGRRRIMTRQNTVFSTERDTAEQVAEMEAADWDAKLNSKEQKRA